MTIAINALVKRAISTLGVLLPITACTGTPGHDYIQVADENPAFSNCSQSAFDRYPGAEQGAQRADYLNACLAQRQALVGDSLSVARIHSF